MPCGHEKATEKATPAQIRAFEEALCVRTEPELRHVLAHLYYAIDHVIAQRYSTARMELKSIEGLIFFEGGDDDYEAWLRRKLEA